MHHCYSNGNNAEFSKKTEKEREKEKACAFRITKFSHSNWDFSKRNCSTCTNDVHNSMAFRPFVFFLFSASSIRT